jgi:hypothetical protein
MLPSRLAVLATCSLLACRDAGGDTEVRLRPAPVTPSPNAPRADVELGPHPGDDRVNQEELAEARASKDKKKGDRQDDDWTPKEFTNGMARFKDTGVYVDGKPVGFLTFGELPIGCKVSWLRDKVSADKRYGTNDPGWKWARKRYYKFTDYLRAVGVDLARVKEVHVYGPKGTQTLIVTGKDLRSPAAEQFYFWFGANVTGKPIPHAAENFGNGRIGDKVNGVMVYVDKKPPSLVDGEGLFLDGVEQHGIPYYGEPIRGGVRIYLDDKLATIIKRQELDPKKATKAADGEPRWSLAQFLADHGVPIKGVAEVWVIRHDVRAEKFSGAELATLTFEAGSQSKGGVLLGDKLVLTNAIALHSRVLQASDLPVPEQDDE